jgi:serine phosphatase RsbU (regulator of sigma subunit)
MKKIVIFIALSILVGKISAQEEKYDFNLDQTKIDSFKDSLRFVNINPKNNDEAYLLLKASSYYFFKNADSTIYYQKLAENYTATHDFKRLQVYNHLFLSQVYAMMKSNFSLATYYVNLAKKERDEFDLKEALIEEDIQALVIMSYSGLGSYTKVKKELDKRSPTIMQQTYSSDVLWNPVAMHAVFFKDIAEYDSAIKYGLMAIEYNKKVPENKKYGYTYYVVAEAFIHKKEFQKALDYLKEGFPYLIQNNFAKDISQAYGTKAQAFFGLKRYDSAIFYANKAYQMSNNLSYINGILKESELLSQIYEDKKQTDSAYKYLKISSELKDVLSDKSKVNEIENINLNEELREKQIQEDAARRKKLIIGFSLFFFIGFTSLITYNKYKQKVKARKQEEERKNNELKAARDLQISMLPKSVPNRQDLDIAAYIRSSTEVGGDYYDFFPQDNGTIYSVCGDATGHGVTSGMMVSVTKAGLNGIDAISPGAILQKLNKVVKKIDLGTLRMSLNIVEITNDTINMSSAAMPPIYLFKASSKQVEEIMNNGLPLGGLKKEAFEEESRSFESGDVLIQLSDGLPEAPNASGEMYDYEQLRTLIQSVAHLSAQEIINKLMDSVDTWLAGKHNPDDITLVVTKKK